MTHKTIKIDFYYADNEDINIDELKKEIEKILCDKKLNEKNMAFEITAEDNTFRDLIDKIEKQIPADPYPGSTGRFPNFPNTKYVFGDTPETWKNQPTCYCYDEKTVDLTYKPSKS